MRVLAVGATGFIGSPVVRLLIEQGHVTAVLHRGRSEAGPPEEAEVIQGDRDAPADLKAALVRFKPEVVLDVIPYTEKQAKSLVETFCGSARRIVAVSSADVYRNYDGFRGRTSAPPDPVPLAENAPLREALYPYRGCGVPFKWADDYDKILVERVVLGEPKLPGTVLRLPAVYGPGDTQHRPAPYLQRMDDGRPAVLLTEEQAEWRWTRGYVENVAAAIAFAVTDDRAAGRVYNLGEAPTPTEREWVQQIGREAGWSGEIVTLPNRQLPQALQQPFDFRYHLATDTRRIREELGFAEPIGRQQALQRTIEWEWSHPGETVQADYSEEDRVLAARRNTV